MLKRSRLVSAFIAALAFGAACTVHNPDEPPVAGPSVLALSLVITVTPDSIPMDGGSQSSIAVTARDPNGKPISGVSLHLDISSGGVVQDFGSLSARTIVTGSDGKASAVYTAPPPPPPSAGGAGFLVSILAMPTGSNFQTSQAQSADIRLTLPGVVLPPAGAPTASFTVTPTPVNMNVQATFDATSSTPGSGASQITSYGWDFGDGGTGTGSKTTHTYTRPGTFTVTLVVTNDRGRTATATQQVAVQASSPPTASFVFSPQNPVVGQAVVFNGDASRAVAGHTIVQWSWIYGDGSAGDSGPTTFTTSHAFSTAGTYAVTLTVMDDTGQRATASNNVTVGTGNPTAVLTLTKAGGNNINADGSASTATGGFTIQTYTFIWGDSSGNTSGSSPSASHTYAAAGTYTVTLRVTDNASPPRTSSATATITVP